MQSKSEENRLLLLISEIRPYLYLSGVEPVNDFNLSQLGITHVVDASNSDNVAGIKYFRKPRSSSQIQYCTIEINDFAYEDLKRFFEPAADFIKTAKDSVL